MRIRTTQGAFTLIEILIVAAISTVLLFAVIMLTTSTQDAYTTVREDTDANFSLRQALNRVSEDLRQSSTEMIEITDGYTHDSISLQVPISVEGSTVNWGAAKTVGLHINILVEDGFLVRRVVDGLGTPMRTDEILARDVDDMFMGVKGFRVTETDGLYTISIRVTANRGQRVWRRTETTSVSTRN